MEMTVANPMNPMNPMNPVTPVAHEDRKHTAQRIANEMFHQQPDWITFFREVLGVDGLLRKLFASPEELPAFASEPAPRPMARSRPALSRSACPRACTRPSRPRLTTARPA